jgi:hypothetical protein
MSLCGIDREKVPGQQGTPNVTSKYYAILNPQFIYRFTQGFEHDAVPASRAEFMRFGGCTPGFWHCWLYHV